MEATIGLVNSLECHYRISFDWSNQQLRFFFINQCQLAAVTNTHTQENDVLRRAYQRQQHYSHQADLDIDTNFALAVCQPWSLDSRHNDFEFHDQQVVPKHQAGITAAYQYINEVTNDLARQRLPKKYTSEKELLE